MTIVRLLYAGLLILVGPLMLLRSMFIWTRESNFLWQEGLQNIFHPLARADMFIQQITQR